MDIKTAAPHSSVQPLQKKYLNRKEVTVANKKIQIKDHNRHWHLLSHWTAIQPIKGHSVPS